MTWDEVRAHAEDGVYVDAHTVSHLRTLGDEELLRELRDSKEEIEAASAARASTLRTRTASTTHGFGPLCGPRGSSARTS
jgi:Polysaccharide deacetylase